MGYSDIQHRIARVVAEVLRDQYPEHHDSLCHASAVLGANLAALRLGGEYRPVAGLAVIDSGAGHLLFMTDNEAFRSRIGGAYHCWIESAPPDPAERVLIDLMFGSNAAFARKNRLPWSDEPTPPFLWGRFHELVPDVDLENLRPGFGKHRIWVRETEAGRNWMARHCEAHQNAYVELTARALRRFDAG